MSCYTPSGRTESYFQAGAVAVFVFGIFVAVLGFILLSFVFPEYVNTAVKTRLSLWDLDSVGRHNFVSADGNGLFVELDRLTAAFQESSAIETYLKIRPFAFGPYDVESGCRPQVPRSSLKKY